MHFLLLALRNVLRNRRRSVATVAAITVGLLAVNLFGGYIANVYAGLRDQAVSGERLGHLTIVKRGMLDEGKLNPKRYMFSSYEARKLESVLKNEASIRLLSPRISVSGIASNGRSSTIFIGEGVVPEHLDILRGNLPAGSGGRIDPSQYGAAAVSSDLAKLLTMKQGDVLTLLTSTLDGQANAMDAQVGDVFDTGNINTNDKFLVLPFSFAQYLMDTDRAERYVVLLDDIGKTESMRAHLQSRLQSVGLDVEIKTWVELSSFYKQVRGLFNMIFGFIAAIVFVIAAMSIASTMAMAVVERTREIGTLRAIGLESSGVVRLFTLEGMWLAILGAALGIALTLVVAAAVNHGGISYVPPNSSYAVPLLVDLDWPRIAVMAALVITLALTAALWPALKASRQSIADALTFH